MQDLEDNAARNYHSYMNVFYKPVINNDLVTLDESESLHAIKVLRLGLGDQLVIFDGNGLICEGAIVNPHPKKCEIGITKRTLITKRPFHLHIAIAPTKMNDRMEWFLEKATEIGIEEITPLICSRSERRKTNHERFRKVIVAAMKQSMHPWLPKLNEQLDFESFISNSSAGYIAHCINKDRIPLRNVQLESSRITIMIGPEGDFTSEEIESALQKQWVPVSLGATRLRTETAGLVACHTITMLMN